MNLFSRAVCKCIKFHIKLKIPAEFKKDLVVCLFVDKCQSPVKYQERLNLHKRQDDSY